ncbi:MAG TPA: hypothetical protein VHL11_21730 [Phototrophicaceae bacterium]|jgi:hypothetical protein|nr:hypothetical protein [Phototrophicaceae bacterium]
MEIEYYPPLWVRRLTFYMNTDFTTPLNLEECGIFLVQPVPPQPWFFKNNPLLVAIDPVNVTEEAKLLFTVRIYRKQSGELSINQIVIRGEIKSFGSKKRQIRYNSTIDPSYIFSLVPILLIWSFQIVAIGGPIWNPLELFFQMPDSIGYFLWIQLPILVGIFSLAYGAVCLFKILAMRRKILRYLDEGLHRGT